MIDLLKNDLLFVIFLNGKRAVANDLEYIYSQSLSEGKKIMCPNLFDVMYEYNTKIDLKSMSCYTVGFGCHQSL